MLVEELDSLVPCARTAERAKATFGEKSMAAANSSNVPGVSSGPPDQRVSTHVTVAEEPTAAPPTPVIAWLAAGVGARAFRDAVLVNMSCICLRRYGA